MVTISIIIPVLNEEYAIGNLVQFIRHLERPEILEILVVDGGSQDNTTERASRSGADVILSPRKSRAVQMNLGAQYAKGEVLYFVHADVRLLPSFVDDIKEALAAGFDSGCYRYKFDSPKRMLRINAFFTRFEPIMCRGGDQTLFIKEASFDALGGYDEAYTIMEDYEFLRRLRKTFSFKIIHKDITVSARKYDSNSWLRVQIANFLVFILFFFRRSSTELEQIYKILLTYR